MAKLSTSFNQERERLEEEVDFLTQQVETLRNRSNESILIAENSRSTAERLAKSEEGVSASRITELTSTVDSLRKELVTERREGNERLSKERENMSELQIELRGLQPNPWFIEKVIQLLDLIKDHPLDLVHDGIDLLMIRENSKLLEKSNDIGCNRIKARFFIVFKHF